MKLIDTAIRELTEERVKKIKFGKGQPKGVGPLKPNKSSGDTKKVGAAAETTKKGSWSADQDVTTGEHYDVLDKEAKRQKKYDHSLSGDYDDGAKDVVKVHEAGVIVNRDVSQAALQHPADDFYKEMFSAQPSSEVDRLSEEFRQAQMARDHERMRSLTDQMKAHNHMAAGGQVSEGVSRILQLAGVKDVREMLVVTPTEELDETGKNKKKSPRREHGLIQENREYDKEHHQRFVEAVENAEMEVYHYRGRYYYEGPAVNVSQSEMPKLYASLHEAGFGGDDLQQDDMAFDKVVYPRN